MTTIAGRTAVKMDAPASHPYSCNTCQVAFRNSDLQKSHMKGDWHRYNLRRRVTSLPPISSEVFAESVLQTRANTAAQTDQASFARVCDVCQKTYSSENSFRNHVSSQKHKAREAAVHARAWAAKETGDEASSVVSSTFTLGEPHAKTFVPVAAPAAAAAAGDTSSEILDSDAEEEFTQVVENLKKANLADKSSPVKRPSNPHLSAAAQRKSEHRLSQSGEAARPPAAVTAAATAVAAVTSDKPDTTSKTTEPAHSLSLCLFCNYASPSVQLSTAHMERFHGMFIPEKQYLVDLEGLLGSLQTRIRDDHECIYCGKIRTDVFAVQTHMRDKGHCKIPYTTLEEQVEIGDFYDFRATYSDSGSDDDEEEEEELASKAKAHGPKLGAKRTVKTTVDGDSVLSDTVGDEDDDDDGEGEGWETDSSASSLDSDDLTAVPAEHHYHQYERLERHPHHSQTDPRAHHQTDGWHSHAHKHNHAVFYDEYELHLPSGRAVGHRSLNRYFRQNLRNYPSQAEREKQAQLALEGGEVVDEEMEDVEDAMELDGEASSAVARTTGSRAVSTRPPPRNTLGLAGVTDKSKAGLVKTERKAVLDKTIAQDKAKIRHSAKSIGQSFRFLGR